MSKSLHWEPVKYGGWINPGKTTASSIIRALEKAFHGFPLELGESDLPMLSAMAVAYGRDDPNPYEEIVQLIEQHEQIRLYQQT
jgi:hypothetical protein